MPTLARWYIKTALVYLVAALLLGVVSMSRGLLDLPPFIAAMGPVYTHLLVVGWLTQLIFGVVYWMFPKYSRDNPRRSERLAWFIYGLLNAGLVLRAVGEPLATTQPSPVAGWMLALSALLQMAAGWFFVANTWGRVKER